MEVSTEYVGSAIVGRIVTNKVGLVDLSVEGSWK